MTQAQKRALALAAARKRKQEAMAAQAQPAQGQQEPGAFDAFARGFGSSIAAPVGLVAGAGMEAANLMGANIENTSGQDFIRSKLEPLGLTVGPGENPADSVAGAAGTGLGMFGIPGAALTGAAAKGGPGLARNLENLAGPKLTQAMGAMGSAASRAPGPSAGAGRRVVNRFREEIAQRPGTAGALELTGGAGAGAGGQLAAQEFGEDNEFARPVGELIGGVLGSANPVAAAKTVAVGGLNLAGATPGLGGIAAGSIRKILGIAPPVAARRAASQRLNAVAPQADQVLTNLTGPRDDVLTQYLSPAQRAGRPDSTEGEGVLSLAARQRGDDSTVLAQWRERTEKHIQGLRDEIGKVTGPEQARLEQELGGSIDAAFTLAAQNATRKLAGMRPDMSRTEASAVMSRELEQALRLTRGQEKELWGAIGDDLAIPSNRVVDLYTAQKANLPKAQQDDIPDAAARFLDPDSPDSVIPRISDTEIDELTPLKELQGVRSALLNEARNARAGSNPNFNKARLAKQMADELLEVMGSGDGETSAAFNSAISFSRRLNDRFSRGSVGELLGFSPKGERKVAPERALSVALGGGGPKAKVAVQDLKRAVGDSPAASVAVQNFLRDEFMSSATVRGEGEQFVPNGANAFMKKYRDMFESLPQMRAEFESAIEAGNASNILQKMDEGVINLIGARNPQGVVRQVKDQLSGEGTGAAWEHFRQSVTRDLQSADNITNLRARLHDPQLRRALREVYKPQELRNLDRIANTLELIRRDQRASPTAAFVTAEPGMGRTMLTRFMAAKGAGTINDMAGGMGPGSLSFAQSLSNSIASLQRAGLRDPISKYLHDALSDEDMMRALFIDLSDQGRQRTAIKTLNAWTASLLDDEDVADIDPAGDEEYPPRSRGQFNRR